MRRDRVDVEPDERGVEQAPVALVLALILDVAQGLAVGLADAGALVGRDSYTDDQAAHQAAENCLGRGVFFWREVGPGDFTAGPLLPGLLAQTLQKGQNALVVGQGRQVVLAGGGGLVGTRECDDLGHLRLRVWDQLSWWVG